MKRFWPILLVLAFIVSYELVAAITNVAPTFSELIWQLDNMWPWFALAVVAISVVLLGHFFLRWWGPARKRE